MLVAGWRVSGELASQLQVNCGLQVSLGLVMSNVAYGNGLVRVVFMSTRVRTGHVSVEFFQLFHVTGRVNVSVFFATLNPNPTLTRPINMICHP